MSAKLEFREPSGDAPAGHLTYKRSRSAYQRFMEEEGIPILRGIGIRDTRELELGRWERLRGRQGHVRRRGPAARRAQAREAHVRRVLPGDRGPWDDRGLAGRERQE